MKKEPQEAYAPPQADVIILLMEERFTTSGDDGTTSGTPLDPEEGGGD